MAGSRCPLCHRRLCVRHHFRGWRSLRVLWFVCIVGLLPLFILLAPLALMLLPLWVPLLFAIGPLNALVHEPEHCALCSGAVTLELHASPEIAPLTGAGRVIDLQRRRRLRRWRRV